MKITVGGNIKIMIKAVNQIFLLDRAYARRPENAGSKNGSVLRDTFSWIEVKTHPRLLSWLMSQ